MPKAVQKQIVKPPPPKVAERHNRVVTQQKPKTPQDDMPPALRKLYETLADRAPSASRYVPKDTRPANGADDPFPYVTKPNEVKPAPKSPKGRSKPIPQNRIIRRPESI